jgi:glutathionyl-hydroquinone reductase
VRHDEILLHYYRSVPALNPHGIVPRIAPPDFA